MRYPLGAFELILKENLLQESEARTLHRQLLADLPWTRDQIRLFGRWVSIPREQCWIGDSGLHYRYSGVTLQPHPWPDWLEPIRDCVNAAAGESFNSVLCNHYRGGRDSMGWHSDDEPELGPDPIIASVTLGEPRRFHFRHRHDRHRRLQLTLPHNSLLIMPAGLQREWQHQLPKSQRAMGSRINLTFRRIVQAAANPETP